MIFRPNANSMPCDPKPSKDECCYEKPHPMDKQWGHETDHSANVRYGEGNAGYDADHDKTGMVRKHGEICPNPFC